MKYILLFLFGISIHHEIFSQTTDGFLTYDMSKLLTGSKTKKITDYLGSDGKGGNYFLKENIAWSTSEFYMDLFGKDLTLEKETTIPLKWEKLTVKLLSVLNLDDRFYLFAFDRDSKTDVATVYLQEINKSSLTLTGKAKSLVTKQLLNNQFSNYSVITSDNNSYFAVIGMVNQKGSEYEQYDVTVFDSSMQKVWNKEIKLPYLEKLFHGETTTIDRKGNLYILGKNYFDKVVDKKKGEPNFNYRIIAYKEGGTVNKDFKVEVPDMFINSIEISPMADGSKLLCGGFYSAKGTYSIKGVVMLTIDMDNLAIESSKSKEFDKILLSRLVTMKKETKTGELYEYDIVDFIRRNDGGFLLVGEQSYVTSSTYYSNGTAHTTYYYHYNNLVIVNISPELNIEWIKDIPKRQVWNYPVAATYALSITGTGLYFVFNQSTKAEKMYATDGKLEDKTLGEEEETKNKSSKEGQMVIAVKVDADGTRYSQKLWQYQYGKMCAIDAAYCKQVSDTDMFFYGAQPGKYQIGFFHFK